MINDAGGVNGRKIEFHHARRRLQPAQDGRADPAARRAGPGLRHFRLARHADQRVGAALSQRAQGAADVSVHRHFALPRPAALSVDDGRRSELCQRDARFCQIHSEGEAGCEDRGAVPERRLRQGPSQHVKGRARRQGQDDGRRRGVLRGHRSDRRLADRQPEGIRRRHIARRRVAQIRRAGDPQSRRDRLASAAHRALPGLVDPVGHAAGRPRPFGRRDHRRVPEGTERPGLAERPGGARLCRFDQKTTIPAPTRTTGPTSSPITWRPRSSRP